MSEESVFEHRLDSIERRCATKEKQLNDLMMQIGKVREHSKRMSDVEDRQIVILQELQSINYLITQIKYTGLGAILFWAAQSFGIMNVIKNIFL